MKAFFAPMQELGEFTEIRQALERSAKRVRQGSEKHFSGILQVGGCIDAQKAHFMAALSEGFSHRLIIAANDLRAKEIYENFKLFDREAYRFPARDFIFFQADVHSGSVDRERIRVWRALSGRLLNGKETAKTKTSKGSERPEKLTDTEAGGEKKEDALTVITTVTALMNHVMPFETWAAQMTQLKVGDEIDLSFMKHHLVGLGY